MAKTLLYTFLTFYSKWKNMMTQLKNRKIAACLALASLYLIRTIWFAIKRKIKKYPPGPFWSVPIFGELFFCKDIVKYGKYLYSNYGNVTMISIGSQKFVHLHTSDVITDVFKYEKVNSRFDTNKSYMFSHLKKSELPTASSNGDIWARKRRIFQSVFLSRQNSSFINKCYNYSLQTYIDKSINKSNNEWYPLADIQYISFNTLWNACFGSYLSYNNNEMVLCGKLLYKVVVEASLETAFTQNMPAIQLLLPKCFGKHLFPSYHKFGVLIETIIYKHCRDEKTGANYDESIFDMNNKTWEKHFTDVYNDNSGSANIISKFISIHRMNPQIDSTKNSILTAVINLFGSHETITQTTYYGILLLSKNIEIQDKIYTQLENVFKDDIYMNVIQFKDVIQKLHLLRACVHEIIRISSVGTGIPHYSFDRDIWIKNATDSKGNKCKYLIPKGTAIFGNIQNANRNSEYWRNKTNNKPMDICLEAWLDENNHFSLSQNKDKMMTFGIGARQCAGQAFAKRQLLVLFAKLILLYKFYINPNTKIKQKFMLGSYIEPQIPIKVTKRYHYNCCDFNHNDINK